jgi:hypothetical protein
MTSLPHTKKTLMKPLKTLRRTLLPPWIRFLNKSFRSYRKLSPIVRELALPPLDPNPLRHRKSSDTLFILGSGASMLGYTADQWDEIGRHDSLGFNFWTLHPFVPTHYVFEFSKEEDDRLWACLVRNLEQRTDVVAGSAIYVKDAERYDQEVVRKAIKALPCRESNPVHILWDADLPGDSVAEFAAAVSSLSRTGCFSAGRYWAVPRNRATVFCAVNLAVRAGYRKIILCGVDLNNSGYFFESPDHVAPPGLCIPPMPPQSSVHRTNDPAHGALTISAILDIFDLMVLQPRGIELRVAKETSALYPRFGAYFPSVG